MPKFIIKKESDYPVPVSELKNYACRVPFKHIEIHTSGLVSACCHTWLPTWVGNVLENSAQDIVNNVMRKEIQDKMREGNFDYCNDQCPQLSSLLNGSNKHWDIIPIKSLDESLKESAMHIGFSYDPSCNLQCPSCRDSLILYRPDDPNDFNGQRLKLIHEKVKEIIDLIIMDHRLVILDITGSGDAFASPLYWDYLIELSENPIPHNLRLVLKTNGVMMTEEYLMKIKPLWPYIQYVEVSVDAATEETYKIVRKNGNFKRLKNNLEVFDRLVCEGSFPRMSDWQTNIVVQQANFRELKEFVEWQLTYKSKPKIWTNLLAQWMHIPDDKFKVMAIWRDDNVNRNELIEILRDPVFKNPQIMLGNMSSLVK